MRLSREEVREITGKERPAAQVRWFLSHYGIELPHDSRGVIITRSSFEGLVAKKCGLSSASVNQDFRPVVRLTKQHASA